MAARAPRSATLRPVRHDWMDGLRGLAILAVLLLHAETTAGPVPLADVVNEHLAEVRMPLLMALSGALVHRSLAKGTARHLRGKVRGILWPYLVWASLDLTHVFVDAAVAGRPVPWDWTLRLLYDPHTYLWFLGYLFSYHVVVTPLAPAVRTLAGPALVLHAGAVPDPSAERYLTLLGWFLVGDALARHVAPVVPDRLVRAAGRTRWGVLATVGRQSIVFYASHLIVMVYVVRILRGAGVVAPGPVFWTAFAVPLLVGAALVVLRTHPAVDLLFRLPSVDSQVVTETAARGRGIDVRPLQVGDHQAQEGGHRRPPRQDVREAHQERRGRGPDGRW